MRGLVFEVEVSGRGKLDDESMVTKNWQEKEKKADKNCDTTVKLQYGSPDVFVSQRMQSVSGQDGSGLALPTTMFMFWDET